MGYGEKMVTVTEDWQEFGATTPVFETDVATPGLTFQIGSAIGGFWIDDVKLYEVEQAAT